MKWLRKLFGLSDPPYQCTHDVFLSWERENKKARPLGYFLYETLPGALGSLWRENVYWPVNNFYHGIRIRLFRKYYLVDTGLSKYRYYDKDELMLHANFSLLRAYVEIELAWMEYLNRGENYPKKWFREWRFREPEMGANYLLYWMNYKNSEEDCDYGMVDKEIKYYTELYALYDWWVNIRPKRVDPYDAEIFSVCGSNIMSDKWKQENPELCERHNMTCKDAWEIEEAYDKEDQDMLHRLIDVRRGLWT